MPETRTPNLKPFPNQENPIGRDPEETPSEDSSTTDVETESQDQEEQESPETERQEEKPSEQDQQRFQQIEAESKTYHLLMNDPEIGDYIRNTLARRRSGQDANSDNGATGESEAPPSGANDQYVSKQEYEQLKDAVQQSIRSQAALQLELFKKETPDFDELKQDAGELINKYGMGLQEAFQFARERKGASKAQQTEKRPAPQPVESGNSGEARRTDLSDDPEARIRERMNQARQAGSHRGTADTVRYVIEELSGQKLGR